MKKTLKQLKKILIAITGFTILAVGFVVIFLPGPASLIIPLGLAVLATEFVWAKTLLEKFKTQAARFNIFGKRFGQAETPPGK